VVSPLLDVILGGRWKENRRLMNYGARMTKYLIGVSVDSSYDRGN